MNLKLTTKSLCKISLILNKMEISDVILDMKIEADNEDEAMEKFGKQIIKIVIENLYKVENEMVELIAELRQISIEDASNEDVIPIIRELLNNEKIKSFLK